MSSCRIVSGGILPVAGGVRPQLTVEALVWKLFGAIHNIEGRRTLPARSGDEWEVCERYDWRSWTSWRAVFASSAVIAFIAAVAGLAADSVVRDLLRMELGGASYLTGPNSLALVLAFGIAIPGIGIWGRILRRFGNVVADYPTRPAWQSGFKRHLLLYSLLLFWLGSSSAVYIFIYAGISTIVADGEIGRLTPLIFVGFVFPYINSLQTVFGAFGARLHRSNLIEK